MRSYLQNLPLTRTRAGTVIARPRTLGCAQAPHVREQLLILLNRGAPAVVVDLSACLTVCACCAIPALLRTHQRARALGIPFRLVMPSASPARHSLDRARHRSAEPVPVAASLAAACRAATADRKPT